MFKDRSLRLLCAGLIALVCGALTALFVSSQLGDVTTLWAITVTTAWAAAIAAVAFAVAYGSALARSLRAGRPFEEATPVPINRHRDQ